MEILKGLTAQQREMLKFQKDVRNYSEGEVIFSPGDSADVVYQVISGRVELQAIDSDGGSSVVSEEGPGDLFGLGALLMSPRIRILKAVAAEPCTLVEFRGNAVELLKNNHGPATANILLKNLMYLLADQASARFYQRKYLYGITFKMHPEYRFDPEQWLGNVEKAVPSGIFHSLFAKTKYEKGTQVVAEGEVPNSFYFLQSGSVKGVVKSDNGQELLDTAHAPGVFGLIPYFAKAPSRLTIQTISEAEIVAMTMKDIENFASKNPEEGLLLLDSLLRLMVIRFLNVEYKR